MFTLPYFYVEVKPVKGIAEVSARDTVVKPVFVYKTDTVIIEKNIPTYVKIPVIKYTEVVQKNSPKLSNALDVANIFEVNNASAMSAPNTIIFVKEQLDAQIKNIARSGAESEELNKFLIVSKIAN